jgi:hypothetical protein
VTLHGEAKEPIQQHGLPTQHVNPWRTLVLGGQLCALPTKAGNE